MFPFSFIMSILGTAFNSTLLIDTMTQNYICKSGEFKYALRVNCSRWWLTFSVFLLLIPLIVVINGIVCEIYLAVNAVYFQRR